jgi:hypothetical protein
VADWAAQYRRVWEKRLDQLDTYLHELKAKEKTHARKPRSK